MPQFKNAMEIFKLLPGTNCRKCFVPTCLAFAVAAFKGDRHLRNCPYLDGSIFEQYQGQSPHWMITEQEYQEALEPLKQRVATIDFHTSAERLGATLAGDKLVIKSLGKDFQISLNGSVASACHVHAWVTVPLLNYIVSCSGKGPSGVWLRFRELKDGVSWGPLFAEQFENPLKRVADANPDLFETMIQIFNGRSEPVHLRVAYSTQFGEVLSLFTANWPSAAAVSKVKSIDRPKGPVMQLDSSITGPYFRCYI